MPQHAKNMTKGNFPIEKLKGQQTPFYYYDAALLKKTVETLKASADKYGFLPHYAVKANANEKVLKLIASYGIGADCVSGGEVLAAVKAGFAPEKIVFAGVGKTDWEIEVALDSNIFCFNAESLPELDVINELAGKKGKIANIELRVNPNVDAHTHAKITTGLNENKFGINLEKLQKKFEVYRSPLPYWFPNHRQQHIHSSLRSHQQATRRVTGGWRKSREY